MASSPPKITVHEYRTPTEGSGDACYSVGIMNLTKYEAGEIAVFARALRRATPTLPASATAALGSMSQLTGSLKPPSKLEFIEQAFREYQRERERKRMQDTNNSTAQAVMMQRANAVLKLSDMLRVDMAQGVLSGDAMDDAVRDAARQPEPTDADAAGEPPNRFSGLDFE